jgi:hypothetical protein
MFASNQLILAASCSADIDRGIELAKSGDYGPHGKEGQKIGLSRI